VATSSQAEAEVLSARAALESASLNLGYTKVVAPISGRIGTAKVTEGALVGQNERHFWRSSSNSTRSMLTSRIQRGLFKLKDELASGHMQSDSVDAKASLLLDNGRKYREQGTMQSSEVTVDASTGSVTKGVFPNPNRDLFLACSCAPGLKKACVPTLFSFPRLR